MQIRGGSSKGIYFKKDDLPAHEEERNNIILDIVGRDERQIDGLGGANPLTSKVAIINKSEDENAHVDFLFVQVVVGENRVDTSPNCGNILAGVGVFALESGMVEAEEKTTSIRVKMLNSGNYCELILQTPNKKLTFKGDAKIDGVEGRSAPIICNYMNIEGSICGKLFPTGKKIDNIDGINLTCIDNGMPVVLIPALSLQISGYEICDELSSNEILRQKLESIRLKAGKLMGLGDVSNKVIPKMSIISPPKGSGTINTRTFIPHNCHAAIGVLGAVSVASACLYKECVTNGIAKEEKSKFSVQHPSGEFLVELTSEIENGEIVIKKSGLLRTARLLSKGVAFLKE
ncbi:MAG: 4-oxalomesaconate tautomerase [Proteobacteria bacterium]|nr:MAG: 4-oxalomesaconate tautomerase [Pseudomonadota bacterium]